MPRLSHPSYYFCSTETHNLSAVRPRPKWLQCNRQVDPRNLVGVIESRTVFEKGDDESWHCDGGTIQSMSEWQGGGCWQGRGSMGRTMANVEPA